jgi:hypothetical protein
MMNEPTYPDQKILAFFKKTAFTVKFIIFSLDKYYYNNSISNV